MSDHMEDEQRNHAFEDGGYPDNTRCTHPLTRYRCMRERQHHALFEQLAAACRAARSAEQRADEAEEAQRIAENVAQMVAGDRDEALMDADETAIECNKLEAQLAERDQQLAALHVSVRTLGAALGACMADPHTGSCRSLWLCEQHRALLESPAGEGE